MSVEIEINDIFSLEDLDKETQKAVTRAINHVLRKKQKQLGQKVASQYYIAKEAVHKAASFKKASEKNLSGEITVKGKVLGLEKFKVSVSSGFLSAGINKTIGSKKRDGSFVRVTRNFAGTQFGGKTAYSEDEFGFRVFKRYDYNKTGGKSRRIRRLYGASIPGLIKNERGITAEIEDELIKAVQDEMTKIIRE